MSKTRRDYAIEFKTESVEYLIRSGKTARKIAAELGISSNW